MFSTFRSRLIGMLLVINLCVLALGATASYFLGELGGRLDTFTQGIYHRLEIANQLRDAASARAIAVRNGALLTDPQQRSQALAEFDRRQQETQRALAELQTATAQVQLPPEVTGAIESIARIENRYRPVAQSIVDMIKAGRVEEATGQIQKVCTPTLNELQAALHSYMVLTEQRTKNFVLETSSTTRWQKFAMLATALSALTVAGLLGYLLQRSVLSTLGGEPEALKRHLGELAEGKLAADGQPAPAPGSLMDAIERMRRQMRDVVEKVRHVSDSIAHGSQEIAAGNADLSVRTENQASNLQRTASAMAQMNLSVQHNAESANAASGLATSVSQAASGGSDVMQRVTLTMADISQSSAKIGDIIGVIDGIAFQTNILALNAAVEAARAGEQGKGFAVVASEVRTLAQRSAEAAKEIKSLVSASVERVEAGSELVTEAGRTVGNIVGEVKRVTSLIQNIGLSVQEQSSGVAEVSASVNALDQSTQQNAALAEQSAAAAESLRNQSKELAEAVAYFRL